MKDLFPPIVTLHRYFMVANRMRETFYERFGKLNFKTDNPLAFMLMMHADDYGIFMFYWYSSLYVVVEGYQQLQLSDPTIDRLLAMPLKSKLKDCRNGTFHFRREYINEKLREFIDDPNSVHWVNELTAAFSEFFLKHNKKALPAGESN